MQIFQSKLISTLRFQILLIIISLLMVPVLVMFYDIFFATKSHEIMLKEREELLGSTVEKQILPELNHSFNSKLNGRKINSINPETCINFLHASFDEAVKPLVPSYPGVRFGLYFPEKQQIFVHGFLREYRKLSPEEALKRERRILTEADSGLIAVSASGRPLSRLTTSLNEQTLEYFAPVIIQDKLVAVVWADERLHPIFASSKNFSQTIRYIAFCIFFMGVAGTLIIVHNLARGVSIIKENLVELEKDLNKLLPDLPGEIGQIALAINKMAISLKEKEKLEEEIRRSERLTALGRLVTGVAHELRNPIGIVNTTVQLMETEFKNIEGLEEYTTVIKEQIDRQNRIIQELLDFGRPAKYLVHLVSVNSLIDKILTFSLPLLHQNNIKLIKELNDLPLIEADGERIKQVFVNLLLNASQAMPEGGTLIIKTYSEDNSVCVEFIDTGQGIAAEDLPNIFDPFYTTREGGTGLGLSISHQIIKNHGGTIGVTKNSPQGSIFKVKLPISQSTGGLTNDTQNINH